MLLAVAFAAGTVACSDDQKATLGETEVIGASVPSGPTISASTSTATVEIPVASLSDKAATASASPVAPPTNITDALGDAVSAAGDGIDIQLSAGELTKPATVRFELPADFDATRYVPAVIWMTDSGEFELVETAWEPGDTEVTGIVTHFSFGWPIKIDTSTIANGLSDFIGGLVTGRSNIDNPTCGDEAAMRAGGVTVTSDTGDLVKWCVGIEEGHNVVKVANNWHAGTQVTFPKTWTVLGYQGAGFDLQAIGDWLDSKSRQTSTTLSRLVGPGQVIVLDPGEITAGRTTSVTAEMSTVSWQWSIALTAVDLYLITVGKLAKLSGDTKAVDLVDGTAFIKCFTDYYGENINTAPTTAESTYDTVVGAAKFGIDCGKDIIQQTIAGRGGVLSAIASRIVGVLAATVGIVYGLVNSLFAGSRALIDSVGQLFDLDSEIGGIGYDVVLVGGTAPNGSVPLPAPQISNDLIQTYLNMTYSGDLDVDGILGPASTAAIKKFQTDNGLPATGQPDPGTVDLLASRAGDYTYLVDGCGYETTPRPDSWYLNCSLSGGVVDIVWQTWTAQGASAKGRVFFRDCDAGCINGEAQYSDVTIEAFPADYAICGDGAPFQLFAYRVIAPDGAIVWEGSAADWLGC